MTIQNDVQQQTHGRGVHVEGATLTFTGMVVLETPKAASLLADISPDHQLEMVKELLEHGAATTAIVQASAHMVLLDDKVNELVDKMGRTLEEVLHASGQQSAEVTEKLLNGHQANLEKLIRPFMDPNAKDGLPTMMMELLANANRHAMKQIQVMLNDDEEGALARAVKSIVDGQKETALSITRALAERDTVRKRTSLRGLRFEEQLMARLPALTRGIGRIEHCAGEAGEKGANTGDFLLTVETVPGGETVTIVIEAKSRNDRMSANKVRAELQRSRTNRGALAGILVADSAETLPDQMLLSQVSDRDFCVAYDPEDGDETALTCAVYMAKVAALAAVVNTTADLDVSAAQREVAAIRKHLHQFGKMEGCHSDIESKVATARTVAADLKSEVMNSLRRLDGILNA